MGHAKRTGLVGRASELGTFRRALGGGARAPRVLYVHGPGGVGKTALVKAWIEMARTARVAVAYVDARYIEPTPRSFLGALALTLGLPARSSPLRWLRALRRRRVVILDTYESVASLDAWIREVLVSQLSEKTLLVLATREPPSADWRRQAATEPGTVLVALRNLEPAASRQLLRRRAVRVAQHAAILDFTLGHPLALTLCAEVCAQSQGVTFRPESAPEVMRALLEQFVREVPDAAHRAALEACALARATTQSLLAAMLAIDDAYQLFEWLASCSFVESGSDGLFPHDLARELLARELRWRDPERHATLLARAHAYYGERLHGSWDWVYLHRDNPFIRMAFQWGAGGNLIVDDARRSDVPALLEMVKRHEGEDSARVATHWFTRQLRGVKVVRAGASEPVGFLATITLDRTTPASDFEADPCTAAARAYVEREVPLRPAEVITLHRFWMARDTYQAVSPVQNACLSAANRHDFGRPRQAIGFLVVTDPEFWAPVAEYTLTLRVPEVDFEVGGRRYGVYAKNWRRLPQASYLDLMMKRALGMEPPPEAVRPPPLVALSLESFAQVVQQALRDLDRPLVLARSPLLYSPLVASRVGPEAPLEKRIQALQGVLREAGAELRAAPRAAKFFRALEATYLVAAPAQEQVAERLGLPFSTYRYQLKQAVARVVDGLWQREIGAAETVRD